MTPMVRVAVAGAMGRMGTIAREALQQSGEYCCGLSRRADPQHAIFDTFDRVLACKPDVLLDLTTQPGSYRDRDRSRRPRAAHGRGRKRMERRPARRVGSGCGAARCRCADRSKLLAGCDVDDALCATSSALLSRRRDHRAAPRRQEGQAVRHRGGDGREDGASPAGEPPSFTAFDCRGCSRTRRCCWAEPESC